MTRMIRQQPVGIAVVASVAAALVWYALASATSLIFHLMPVAPTLAAAFVVRWAVGRAPSRARRSAILGLGAAVAVVTTLSLGLQGRPLDEPPLTVAAIAGGVAIGAWLLRPAAFKAASFESPVTDVSHHTSEHGPSD